MAVSALLLCLASLLLPSLSLALSISPPTNTTADYLRFSFPYFDVSFLNTNLTRFPSASIPDNGALQITPDTQNDAYSLTNKSGRIFLTRSFLFWEETKLGTRVASFYTAFDLNIYQTNQSAPGEGFAFLVASSLEGPPPASFGGYLGLTNSTLNGNSSNKFVAVELDTVKQPYDIDNNHVGLDVNGVNSTIANSLTPFGIVIAPRANETRNYTVWIDYDGEARNISVYMAQQNSSKPTKPVLTYSIDLSKVIDKNAYVGFSASTGIRYELNCVLAWELMVERLHDEESGLSKLMIAIIVGASCILVIFALVLLGFYINRKRVKDDPAMLTGTLRSLPGMPREFDIKELKKGTNNFDEKMKLGQGGFGVVYKGVLVGDNEEDMLVAVKQFSRSNTKGQEDFLQELSIINRLRHRNLVRLVGTYICSTQFSIFIYFCIPSAA